MLQVILSDFAQRKLFLFKEYDLIIVLQQSERHKQQWHTVEGPLPGLLKARHQQMRCDSWEKTQDQLMG